MNCAHHLCVWKKCWKYDFRLFLLASLLLLVITAISPVSSHAQTYTDLHDLMCASDGCRGDLPGIPAQARDGNFYGTLPAGGNFGQGVVYRLTPRGSFSVIHHFNTTDGSIPYGGLTLGSDGNLYGTTSSGGASNYGTIFQITTAGVLTTLHDFIPSEVGLPWSAPVEGKKGFYGLSVYGRPYMITPAGAFKLLPNSIPGVSRAPLVLATDGNFYGTTYTGGLGYGTVFRMSSSGVITIIYKFDSTHGNYPVAPVTQASDGYLYGTTQLGGAHNGGVVFKMSTAGKITLLHEFDSTVLHDGYYPVAGLITGNDGNLYGATSIGQASVVGGTAPYGTFFKVTRTGTYSILHVFDQGHGGSPESTPVQHTNGIHYGETFLGGASGAIGVLYTIDAGLPPFVSVLGIPSGLVGQTVQILGQGFSGASSVKFGSAPAGFMAVSDNYLTATVPTAGITGNIVVTTASGTLLSKQVFKVLPTITSISPLSGAPGTFVAIKGTGLAGTTKVQIGGVNAIGVGANASGTQVNAIVPATAVTGKIKVTTGGGTATSSAVFTVN